MTAKQMTIETVPVDSLTLDPANARKHDERNLEAIKASLARFGQQHPLVVSAAGSVVAGNGRLMAARELGWTEINVIRTDLTGAQLVAFGITDNRTAELAEWDNETLAQLVQGIAIDDDELAGSLGFTQAELEALVINPVEVDFPDIDDKPELVTQTFTLHQDQQEIVNRALAVAKERGLDTSDVNENKNGNCLYAVCVAYLNGNTEAPAKDG